jgi:16S rRNA (uracil1498-N3)-methyltransferase
VLSVGDIDLPPAQARHLHAVLRLRSGDAVELFDDAGASAEATILASDPAKVTVRVARVTAAQRATLAWTVAAAVPKGPRADWMVEKLAELGTTAFVPLIAERSVSLPEGKQKLARWARLAAEASRQSGRTDVMRIAPLTPVSEIPAIDAETKWYMSTHANTSALKLATSAQPPKSLLMLIGPEGGWTEAETAFFDSAGLTSVGLGRTILRVETAAIAAAALAAAWGSSETI